MDTTNKGAFIHGFLNGFGGVGEFLKHEIDGVWVLKEAQEPVLCGKFRYVNPACGYLVRKTARYHTPINRRRTDKDA